MSPLHPASPEIQDQARKINDFSGGSDVIGGVPPPDTERPPVNPRFVPKMILPEISEFPEAI